MDIVLECVIGLFSDTLYFLGLSMKPLNIDKLLYQSLLSGLRIAIYFLLTFCVSVEGYFPLSFKMEGDYWIVVGIEITLNLILSWFLGGFSSRNIPSTSNNNTLGNKFVRVYKKSTRLQMILLLFVLPVLEEVFFRYLLFNRWISLIGWIPALFLQSIWFLVNHSPFLWARCFRAFSYALAYYFSNGSLIACSLCHIMNNIVAFSLDSS